MKKMYLILFIIIIYIYYISINNKYTYNKNISSDNKKNYFDYSKSIKKLLYYNWSIQKKWTNGTKGTVIITSSNSINNKQNFAKTYSGIIETLKINQIIFEDWLDFETNINNMHKYKNYSKFDLYYLMDKNIIMPIEFVLIRYPKIKITKLNHIEAPKKNEIESVYYILSLIGNDKLEFNNNDEYISILKKFVIAERNYEKNLNDSNIKKIYNEQKTNLFNYYINSNSWIKSEYNFFSQNNYNSKNNTYEIFFKHFNSIDAEISNLNSNLNSNIADNYNEYKNYFKEKKFESLNILKTTKKNINNSPLLLNLDELRIQSFTEKLKESDISYIVIKENK